MNSFMRSKLLNVKEDLLATNTTSQKGVKRNLRIMVEVAHENPSALIPSSEWKLRVEGRILSNATEDDILKDDGDDESGAAVTHHKRFL